MNKTEKRQCLDEIEFLGKSKQHSSTFVTALKGVYTFTNVKGIEEMLGDKIKVYNYAYTNIFKKYNIDHFDLYGELDKVWSISINERKKSKQEELVSELARAPVGATSRLEEDPFVGTFMGNCSRYHTTVPVHLGSI